MVMRRQKPNQHHQRGGYDHSRDLSEAAVDPDAAQGPCHRGAGIDMFYKNVGRHACHYIPQKSAPDPCQRPQKCQKKRIFQISAADACGNAYHGKDSKPHRVHHQHGPVIQFSRLSLEHVEDLNEWLHKKIKVRVITADPKKKRLVLSARELLREAAREEAAKKRESAMEQTQVGDVMEGVVETLKDYGAFVRLDNGLSGLVHVSQISDKRVTTPAKVLKEGETVKVKVIAIKDGKLSLSMKALIERPQDEEPSGRDYKLPKSESISTNLGSLLANLKL